MEEQEAYQKAARYCAYQERCRSEVRTKLRQSGASPQSIETILTRLEQEHYLDEERYARTYVRGKFRINGWGRLKIRNGLRAKQIDNKLIETAIKDEINEQEYMEVLRKILSNKGPQTALSRGFEPRLFNIPDADNF